MGNVTKVTDALGRATTYAYDAESNLTQVTSPAGSVESMAYDLKGRMSSLTSPSGANTRYDYDVLDNLLAKSFADASAEDVTYSYDGEGQKVSRSDKTGEATFTYDGAGRLASETDGFGQKLEYAYDDAGRLASITYPEGEVATYAYDEVGNLASVTAPEGIYAYAYDDAARPVALTRPDGSVTRTAYDKTGNVTHVVNEGADGKELSAFSYTYDPEGRIVSEDSSVVGEDGATHEAQRTFTYTPAGKLAGVEATEDGRTFTERYDYDDAGNRIHLVREGADADDVTYTYDADDRLTEEVSAAHGVTSYVYDADGQLVSKTGPDETLSLSYGVEGRLEAVMSGDLLYMAAVYDGDGNKTSSATLYHTSRTLPDDPVALTGAEIIGGITGGDEGDVRIFEGVISAAMHAMAALTGGMSACANPALAPEAVPLACRLASDIFGRGASYVPQGLPDLFLRMRDGKATKALARSLLPKASFTTTDEAYDITSYVTSSLFEVPEVLATSSTRDGKTSVFYGLQRLSEVREGAAEVFLHDGRGSVAQTILGSSVASWHRYGAFGKVTAGSDTQERTFFGYDSEEQDPLTGLLYLRARYYDTSSARFGVADTYLGNTFDPITQNRYLYCASDPVNHADPTGHYTQRDLLNWGLSRGGRAGDIARTILMKRSYSASNAAQKASQSFGRLFPGSWLQSPSPSQYKVTGYSNAAWGNRNGRINKSSGNSSNGKTYADQARELFFRIYCGSADSMSDAPADSWSAMGANMHDFANRYFMIPIVGTAVDWLAYVSEKNVGMTALYSLLTLSEVLAVGGAVTAGKTVIRIATTASKSDDVADIIKAGKTAATSATPNTTSKVSETSAMITEWLGDGAKFIRNSNDDAVLLSADYTKRVRFDFNHPAQHTYPHMHVEELVNGQWIKSGPIFPADIPGK